MPERVPSRIGHYRIVGVVGIRDLDKVPVARRQPLQSFLALARDLLVKTVANGIETAAEARACSEIGFTHAQGFHIGLPRATEEI
jgi:predicted signal transduction protein with EAL and GGDEF domain